MATILKFKKLPYLAMVRPIAKKFVMVTHVDPSSLDVY